MNKTTHSVFTIYTYGRQRSQDCVTATKVKDTDITAHKRCHQLYTHTST